MSDSQNAEIVSFIITLHTRSCVKYIHPIGRQRPRTRQRNKINIQLYIQLFTKVDVLRLSRRRSN